MDWPVMANVDAAEVSRFSAVAEQWWQPRGIFKTLHVINPLRLGYMEQRLSLSGKAVVDVGCGGGLLSEALAQAGARVTGIDAGGRNIEVAREHAAQSQLDIAYFQVDAEQFVRDHRAQFDLVCCMELLEHVPDPGLLVSACAGLARTGGHVVFSTINRSLQSYFSAILVAEYLLALLPRGTHRYRQFIRPSELRRWCRAGGLEVADITGMQYVPGIDRCYLRSTPGVNYLMDTIKIDG